MARLTMPEDDISPSEHEPGYEQRHVAEEARNENRCDCRTYDPKRICGTVRGWVECDADGRAFRDRGIVGGVGDDGERQQQRQDHHDEAQDLALSLSGNERGPFSGFRTAALLDG